MPITPPSRFLFVIVEGVLQWYSEKNKLKMIRKLLEIWYYSILVNLKTNTSLVESQQWKA